MMVTKVSIIYRHQLWADALHALVEGRKELRVSRVFSLEKLTQWADEDEVIYLLEAIYPDAQILQSVKFLKGTGCKVIVIGYIMDNTFVELLLDEGLDGYVLKSCCKDSLFTAINNVDKGDKYFCGPVTEVLSQRLRQIQSKPFLTDREKEVLVCLVSLKKSAEIALSLNISEATVRTHRKNIMRKFGTKNYIGLLRYACREGILDSPGENFCLGCKRRACLSTHSG